MILFSTFALAGVAMAAASPTGANTTDPSGAPSVIAATGAFILECDNSQSLDSLVKTVLDQGVEIRHQFNSKVFYGLSVELHKTTMTEHGIGQMPGVTKVWPVETRMQPAELPAVPETGNQRRDTSSTWNHVMTQVDKLHAAGYTGQGIRIAIVDSGVRLFLFHLNEKKDKTTLDLHGFPSSTTRIQPLADASAKIAELS